MSLPNNTLVLALPRVSPADLVGSRLLRTIRRARVRHGEELAEVLDRVLGLLDRDAPRDGRAALRLLGQTGAAPADWVAAADPVHMETCIDHLRVHALPPSSVSASEMQAGFERLQAELGEDDSLAFRSVGEQGYVESRSAALDTPQVSPLAIDGREPSPFMPDGTDGGGGRQFHRLHSEVQMVLHDASLLAGHPERGTLAVNALWIWGGGRLPDVTETKLPALYSDDALVRGYWRAAGAEPEGLPQTLGESVAVDGMPCIVVSERFGTDLVREAVDLLNAGRIRRLILFLERGLELDVRRTDRFCFWRRPDPELDVRLELR